eukprot:CAMPEP_0183376702 /NCGR_PEP_ID=MMETSP0164_2-20130417/121047_1 /TAXON_ID=221442 /ORGANISM="Coccolithus pelagicus ssp braarudi, Strain PLY182g" /LENGTH=96 /DNA_ID=CAMNT_0025554059 /DNA_START=189 /DNA_END=475 /DNA_ORIENTATION=+
MYRGIEPDGRDPHLLEHLTHLQEEEGDEQREHREDGDQAHESGVHLDGEIHSAHLAAAHDDIVVEYDQVGKPHDGNLDWPEKTGQHLPERHTWRQG